MSYLLRGILFVGLPALLLASCAASSNKTMRCPGPRRNPPKHFSATMPQVLAIIVEDKV